MKGKSGTQTFTGYKQLTDVAQSSIIFAALSIPGTTVEGPIHPKLT